MQLFWAVATVAPLRVVAPWVVAPVVSAVTGMLFRAGSLLFHSKRVTTMTALHVLDPYELLTRAVSDTSPGLLRTRLQTFNSMLLFADVNSFVGAEYGFPSPGRLSGRHGYHTRPVHTRLSTIDVRVPKLVSAPISQNGYCNAGYAPNRPRLPFPLRTNLRMG